MADIGNTAVEKLQYGVLREYTVYEGAASAADAPEFDYGTGDVGGYTYASLLKSDDFVAFLTSGTGSGDFTVARAGATANGNTICGVAVGAPQGKAGGTREARVYHFCNWDVILVKVKSDGTALAKGDKFSLAARDTDAPHGFTVTKDATNGMGHALNAAAAGEYAAILCKPGTFATA